MSTLILKGLTLLTQNTAVSGHRSKWKNFITFGVTESQSSQKIIYQNSLLWLQTSDILIILSYCHLTDGSMEFFYFCIWYKLCLLWALPWQHSAVKIVLAKHIADHIFSVLHKMESIVNETLNRIQAYIKNILSPVTGNWGSKRQTTNAVKQNFFVCLFFLAGCSAVLFFYSFCLWGKLSAQEKQKASSSPYPQTA